MKRRLAGGAPPQLLCVDDDPATRIFYRRVFEAHGFGVLLAENGTDALRTLSRRRRVDAVVSDYDMPEINGAELASALRAARRRIPFILISGSAEMVQDPPSGVHLAVAKGTPLGKLVEAIEELLRATPRRTPQLTKLRPLLPLGEVLVSIALAAFVAPRFFK
jgi:two-component system, OmpR family, response regulator PrrA